VPRSTINFWRHPFWLAVLLFLAVGGIFLPSVWNDFSNFDDPAYVTFNPHIHHGLTWSAIRWAFGSFYAANWHPITWLSHILDFTLFGRKAWGHHLTSVIFHSANVALLFLILSKATGSTWRSAVVAILFGVHPLHVESVAWVAERKDVLNTFFALLTLLAYLQCTQHADRRSTIWYFLALFFFALSLGSKAMSVTLPMLLLLLDYWPLRRLNSAGAVRRAIAEKIPFFALSVAVAGITVAAQNSGHAIKLDIPVGIRFANAVVSVSRYLGKLFWPHDLIVFYPYEVPSSTTIALSILLLLCISAATIVWRRTLPWLFVGWWWLVISLLPVIGLLQIGAQAMADRYMYWPSIGPFVAMIWAASCFVQRFQLARPTRIAAACVLMAAAATVTERQISFWRNSETLFRHAIAIASENPLAHLNLGVALTERGAASEGLSHLREAANLLPIDPDNHLNLGIALHQNGDLPAAISEFQMTLRIKPDSAKAHANLALAFQEQNDLDRSVSEYREALRLDPASPDVRVGFGLALQRSGQIDAALAQFEEAIKEDPSYTGAHSNRGIVLEKLGRLEEAVAEYRKALSLDPKNSDASLNLPVVLFKTSRVEEAIAQVRELIKRRPDYAEAYFNLGGMLYSKADLDGAIGAYQHALKLKPDYPDARHNLNVALEDKAAKSR
jgi:tetratricopeptide (TPR) repeat protein